MGTFLFGSPDYFVKGMAEQVITDPTTGNIVGYDRVPSEAATTTSFNLGAIEGGLHNALILNIPDTSRVSGTATSQAFSLEQRANIFGNDVQSAAVTPSVATITATGSTLTVPSNPEKAPGQPAADTYGWCYVREKGASTWLGTNYRVDLATGAVVDFTATSGKIYEVQYWVNNASAKILPIPATMMPKVLSLTQKFCVYTKGVNGSVSTGTLAGYLFHILPRVQFTGNGGISGNQTANSTTDYSWSALLPDESELPMANSVSCSETIGNYGYFIYCPCDPFSRIKYWDVLGGDALTFVIGAKSVKVPVVYILDDGTVVDAPWYGNFHLEEMSPAVTVSRDGYIDVSAVSTAGTVSQGYLENDVPAVPNYTAFMSGTDASIIQYSIVAVASA